MLRLDSNRIRTIAALITAVTAVLTFAWRFRNWGPIRRFRRRISSGIERLIPSESKYFKRLEKELSGKGFLPALIGLQLTDALHDYVDMHLTAKTADAGVDAPGRPLAQEELRHWVRDKHRFIWIGHAGAGKTTFVTREILTIRRQASPGLLYGQNVVPVFVSLRLVDPSISFPIYQHLRSKEPFFAGASGHQRLIQLAANRRLWLILDGYDEVILPSGREDKLRDELAIILAGFHDSPATALPSDPEALGFYRSLEYCKVWLTSRVTYYLQNRIPWPTDPALLTSRGQRLSVIQIDGIALRESLAAKIFARFRRGASGAILELNELEFVRSIDRTGDANLITWSHNALWLCLLARLYANQKSNGSEFSLTGITLERIVNESLDLLLDTIDAQKRTAGSPITGARGYEPFRSEARVEKHAFLRSFALDLVLRKVSTFTRDELRNAAREYFRLRSPIESSSRTLRQIVLKVEPADEWADQLIAQNVFIPVDEDREGLRYDFPHRRFRECLALGALRQKVELSHDLAARAQDSDVRALFVLHFEAGDTQIRDSLLDALIEEMVDAPPHVVEELAGLLTECVNLVAPVTYDPSRTLVSGVRRLLGGDSLGSIPSAVLSAIREPGSLGLETLQWMREALTKANWAKAQRASSVLASLEPHLLEDELRRLMPVTAMSTIFVVHSLANLGRLHPDSAIRLLPDAVKHALAMRRWAAAASKLDGLLTDPTRQRQIIKGLGRGAELGILLAAIRQYNPAVAREFTGKITIVPPEVLLYFMKVPQNVETILSTAHRSVFYIEETAIAKLDQRYQRHLRPLCGSVLDPPPELNSEIPVEVASQVYRIGIVRLNSHRGLLRALAWDPIEIVW